MHQQAVAAGVAALERAFLQVDDVVSARVLVNQPDEIGAAAGQAAGGKAGVVVALLDQLEDTRACLAADVRLTVEHARDCLDRDTRGLGNVVNGDATHSGDKLSCCQTTLSNCHPYGTSQATPAAINR